MARSRKDSTGSTVVDSYRKQIAKHDTKKSRVSLKENKFKAQMKENASSHYKDIFIMILAMLLAGACVYLILYVILSSKSAKPMIITDM